ncbi:MAG: serine protease [Lachnospiraceae bacterium]|nr:serine protease [Lachnospiraceae bacterium]
MEAIQILGIFVLLVGIFLIGVEFYMPGFGVPGISGILCTVAGIFLTGKNTAERVYVGLTAIVIIAIMLVVCMVLFKKKAKSPITLDTDLQGRDLFIEEKDMEYLIGKKGVAEIDLRPLGKGEFDGVTLDVVSSGRFIDKGTRLVITKIKDNRIIVEEDK